MKKILLAIVIAIVCTSCDTMMNVAKQLQGIANLVKCEYSLKNVDNIAVAGVNLKNVTQGNINAGDILRLTSALVNKSIPLSMDVNMNVKNPTQHNANMTHLDWALDIENSQFATGAVNNNYTIAPQSTSTVPLSVGTDVYSLFSKKGIESLKSFASSFSNQGTSSKLGLRIRPSLTVAGQTFKAPNYITLTKKI